MTFAEMEAALSPKLHRLVSLCEGDGALMLRMLISGSINMAEKIKSTTEYEVAMDGVLFRWAIQNARNKEVGDVEIVQCIDAMRRMDKALSEVRA